MSDLRSDEEPVYYAYTVSDHPSSPFYEESRYRLIYSQKKLPEQYAGFLEGHLYFPKFVNLGKLTTAHIELFQTCVDKTSSDSELREDAACDMDVWDFTFTYFRIGSKRMSEEGAHSAYFLPDQDYMLLAFPLWEIFSIPAAENNIEEDILLVKTWSKENKRFVLEVVYPYQLLSGGPRESYQFFPKLSFTFGSMRFVRKFIPHRLELSNKMLREMILQDVDRVTRNECDEFSSHRESVVTDGIKQLRKFARKRDEVLEDLFGQSFKTQFWERQEAV